MSVNFHGFKLDVNWSGRLAWAAGRRPGTEVIALRNKGGFIIHYGGGATNWSNGALPIWQAYARYHQSVGRFLGGYAADGLMYHIGADFDGKKVGLVDPRRTRWHAGSAVHNRTWVAISIPIGGNQDCTPAQKVAMEEMIHDGITNLGIGQDIRRAVRGHLEVGSTICPGRMQQTFVQRLQNGHTFLSQTPPPKPKPKPEPEENHLVLEVPGIGTFWIIHDMYKRWAMCPEPMFLFGFPIEGMKGDPPYQNFERARMEKQPGKWPDRHDVMLARVGAELAEKRYGSKFNNKEDMFDPEQKSGDTASRRYFDQTKHTVQHGFKSFWDDFGGTEYFGYPISREFQEDGKTVQYFERARFEHHPGYDKIYHDVMLGRVNAELLNKRVE